MIWLGSQDWAVSELRARNGRGRIPQSAVRRGGRAVWHVVLGSVDRLVGVEPRWMYRNVTQRPVSVPCLSLSLCRRAM